MSKSSAHELDALEIEPDIKPGERLQHARVAANISIEEVAHSLNLSVATIRNLEEEEYQKLPGPTFVRGYLKAYARLLGIHPESVLETFDKRGFEPPKIVDLTHTPQARSSDFVFRISTLLILLVLGTLVIVWWQSQRVDQDPAVTELALQEPSSSESLKTAANSNETAVQSMYPLSRQSPPALGEGTNDAHTDEVVGGAPDVDSATFEDETTEFGHDSVANDPTQEQTESIEATSSPRTVLEPIPTRVDAPPDTAPPTTEIVPEAVSDTSSTMMELDRTTVDRIDGDSRDTHPEIGPLRLDADDNDGDRVTIHLAHDSWVEVFDTRGKRLYYDLAREGHTLELKGAGPISVLLGYGRDAQVEYNGVPFDHSPYLRHDVARFTLGEDIQRSVE